MTKQDLINLIEAMSDDDFDKNFNKKSDPETSKDKKNEKKSNSEDTIEVEGSKDNVVLSPSQQAEIAKKTSDLKDENTKLKAENEKLTKQLAEHEKSLNEGSTKKESATPFLELLGL